MIRKFALPMDQEVWIFHAEFRPTQVRRFPCNSMLLGHAAATAIDRPKVMAAERHLRHLFEVNFKGMKGSELRLPPSGGGSERNGHHGESFDDRWRDTLGRGRICLDDDGTGAGHHRLSRRRARCDSGSGGERPSGLVVTGASATGGTKHPAPHMPTFSVNVPTTPIRADMARVPRTIRAKVKSVPDIASTPIMTGKMNHPRKK